MAERPVRFLPQFFEELDQQLPTERGHDGAPSATDFLLYDLPTIRDALASDFERNTLEVAGAEPIRVLIGSGTLVRAVAVYAFLTPVGVVAVIGVAIQPLADEIEDPDLD